MKGAIGRHVIGWMKIYFQFNCEIMPTTGRCTSLITTHVEKFMMYINQKWWSQVINQSHKVNSQDCGEHGLGMLLFRVKYAWGIARFCANLKSLAKGANSSMEKDMSKKLLQEHREAQSLE